MSYFSKSCTKEAVVHRKRTWMCHWLVLEGFTLPTSLCCQHAAITSKKCSPRTPASTPLSSWRMCQPRTWRHYWISCTRLMSACCLNFLWLSAFLKFVISSCFLLSVPCLSAGWCSWRVFFYTFGPLRMSVCLEIHLKNWKIKNWWNWWKLPEK